MTADNVNVPGSAFHAKAIQIPARMAHANVVQAQHAADQQIHAPLENVNAVPDKHAQDRRLFAGMEHAYATHSQTVTQILPVPVHLLVHIHTLPRFMPVNVDQTLNARGQINVIAVLASKVCMLNHIHGFRIVKTYKSHLRIFLFLLHIFVVCTNDADCTDAEADTCIDGYCYCGMGNTPCSGTTDTCTSGSCFCGGNAECAGNSDTCTAGDCKCGTNNACSGTTDTCNSGICRCGGSFPCSGLKGCFKFSFFI